MYDYAESEYKKRIRITDEDLEWIKKNKGKKSAAGFLEEIIKQYKNNEGNEPSQNTPHPARGKRRMGMHHSL